MANSLVKFSNKVRSGNQRLWWGRAEHDGLPYRGAFAPLMPEAEYEQRVVRVADFRNNFFDVTDEGENRLYVEVMECCANGWFALHHIERFWRGTTRHYLEWLEYYLEDGTRTPYLSPGMTEVGHGSANRG